MRIGLVIALALVSCKPSIKGKLQLTTDGSPVAIKSALYVPMGTDSFRVEFSSVERGCDWARRETTGAIAAGEVLGSLDLAPVIGVDGVAHWHVVGAGWTSDSRAAHETSGNIGRVDWPADVTMGSGCNQHINVDNDEEKTLHVRGNFDAICCGPIPPPLPTPPPMTVKAGTKTYPLTSAWAKQQKDGRWQMRLSRGLPACSDEVGSADLFVDAWTNADTTSFTLMGQVLPMFGYESVAGGQVPTVARTGDTLDVNGTLHARRFGSVDGQFLDLEIRGHLPLTTCPP